MAKFQTRVLATQILLDHASHGVAGRTLAGDPEFDFCIQDPLTHLASQLHAHNAAADDEHAARRRQPPVLRLQKEMKPSATFGSVNVRVSQRQLCQTFLLLAANAASDGPQPGANEEPFTWSISSVPSRPPALLVLC